MVCVSEATSYSNARRGAVLLMDWDVAGITPPTVPSPVPETQPPPPQEMPEPKEPIGTPPPMENPVPVREPPVTVPPRS